jgi:VWFA-related protein
VVVVSPNFRRLLLFVCVLCYGQTPAPEVNSQDVQPTFTTRANLVLVRVVVRDKAGRANGTLQKEDFQLFDKGKPQVITKFSMEKSEGRKVDGPAPAPASVGSTATLPGEKAPPIPPDRYVAYVFDDVHLSFGDLAIARKAAQKHISESLPASSRAAIYTTSGQTMLEFTDDQAKLEDTLLRIQPRGRMSQAGTECPDMSFYQADLIFNKNDQGALQAAISDAMQCAQLDTGMQSAAQSLAQAAASRVIAIGETETRLSLKLLGDVVRRMSALPGQRSVVVVSPGFLVLDNNRTEELDLIDRAIRANVTIGGLDARGLYVLVPGGDASNGASVTVGNPATLNAKTRYMSDSALIEADVLGELADGTGGNFFHNSNDLPAGFKYVAALPEYYYVLGFAPQNLKFDGSYHGLKVSLKNPAGLTLQARRGYFAPKHEVDAAQEAKREIEETLFSRDEWHDIPVELHTQFFKSSDVAAKLSILARIDVRQLRFRKADGRNVDTLTVVAGVFDRNGNYISAIEKTVDMHLKDESLASKLGAGITVRSAFDVTPGSYFVRIVVRDAEGQKMAALNGAVEIP